MFILNSAELLALRLSATGLLNAPFKDAVSAVAHLGAVQAQEFAVARWGLGVRIKGSTDDDINREYDAGRILRIHVMRPTWHLVLPADIRWMLALTAPRVKAAMGHYNARLELDAALFARSQAYASSCLSARTLHSSGEPPVFSTASLNSLSGESSIPLAFCRSVPAKIVVSWYE